jgi:hypothetical protein
MSSVCARFARVADPRRWLVLSVVAAICVVGAAASFAQTIDRVEEDWRLVVSEPDTLLVSPQVTCTISPSGNLNSDYAVFDVNLRNFPSYEAGGVQLQLWNGDSAVSSIRSKSGVALQGANEEISWTQRMTIQDNHLSFEVVDGQSTTWGAFGDGSSISVTKETDLDDLNGYSPELTVENSGVGFGSNRVGSLTLVAIRLYSGPTLVAQVTTPVVVYPQP